MPFIGPSMGHSYEEAEVSKQADRRVTGWRRCFSSQRGIETVEWIAVAAVILTLLAGMLTMATPMGRTMATSMVDKMSAWIARWSGEGSTSSGTVSSPSGVSESPGDFSHIVRPSVSIPSAVGDAVGSDEGDKGTPGLLGQIGGFFKGIGEGAWDTVTGIVTMAWDGLRGLPITGDIYGIFDPEGRDEVRAKYGQLWDALKDDPLGTGKQMLYAMVEPMVTDWNEGRYGEAIGRGVFEAITTFGLPESKVGKLGIVAKIDKMLPDELFTWLAKVDKLTPDELASLLARIDKMTPDEVAGWLAKADRFTPDEAALLFKKLDAMTPDEMAALLKRLDNISPDEMAAIMKRLDELSPDEAARVRARLRMNRSGVSYPSVIDPRTGQPIQFPEGDLVRVPKSARVEWGLKERGEFIAEWYRQGYPTPSGGWSDYDIHHIRPREFGGTNDFWNLVPVKRTVHQQQLNPFWADW